MNFTFLPNVSINFFYVSQLSLCIIQERNVLCDIFFSCITDSVFLILCLKLLLNTGQDTKQFFVCFVD